MPNPQPLPRKFLSQLQQAQANLRLLARRAHNLLGQLESGALRHHAAQTSLMEIESDAYRIALELAELKVVEDCTGCPCAPPRLPAQIHLLALADELERQARLARQRACDVGDGHAHDGSESKRTNSNPLPIRAPPKK